MSETSTPKPKTRSHTFSQEIQIAEGATCVKTEPVVGYEFNAGKRKFHDKVDKTKSYD